MVSKEMKEFFQQHQKLILKNLKQQGIIIGKTPIDQIIRATSYTQREITHPNACSYYQKSRCHNLERLNCFLCGCPNYDTESESGNCKLNCKLGDWFDSPTNGKIWDCNGCNHPHYSITIEKYIQENLNTLKKIQEEL